MREANDRYGDTTCTGWRMPEEPGVLASEKVEAASHPPLSESFLSDIMSVDQGLDSPNGGNDRSAYSARGSGGRRQIPDCITETCEALVKGALLINNKEPAKASLFLRGAGILKRRCVMTLCKPVSALLVIVFLLGSFAPLVAGNRDRARSTDTSNLLPSSSAPPNAFQYAGLSLGERSSNPTTTCSTNWVRLDRFPLSSALLISRCDRDALCIHNVSRIHRSLAEEKTIGGSYASS
jgi:hypothetical protein